MTKKARKLAQRLSNGGTFTVRITKLDGGARQMRFEIEAHAPVRFAKYTGRPFVRVRDLDRQAVRTLRLDAVHQLTEAPRRSSERAAAQAGIDLMFA